MNEKKYFLYLKESPAGLKYLGKTIRNPLNYRGSGIYWTRHLKKYNFKNSDIKTTILLETYDEEELKKAGLYYSKKFNIVENKEFANLIEEIGQGGRTKYYEKHKENMRLMAKNMWTKEKREEQSRRMKENNPSKRPDVRKKISEKATGRNYMWTKEKREEQSRRLKENNPSHRLDVRKKISESLKGHTTSEVTREKIRNSLKLTRDKKKREKEKGTL